MWVRRPGFPSRLCRYLKTFWAWFFISEVCWTAGVWISLVVHHISILSSSLKSRKWLMCSERAFGTVIGCFPVGVQVAKVFPSGLPSVLFLVGGVVWGREAALSLICQSLHKSKLFQLLRSSWRLFCFWSFFLFSHCCPYQLLTLNW